MSTRFSGLVRMTFILLDLFVLNLSVILCRLWFSNEIPPAFQISYVYFWVFLNVAWIFISWGGSIYQGTYTSSFERFSRRTTHAYVYYLAVIMLYLFFYKQNDLSRVYVFTVIITIGVGLTLNRIIYLFTYHIFKGKHYLVRNISIIGYNDMSKKLVQHLESDFTNTRVVGYFENYQKMNELSNYPILGELNDVIAISQKHDVNEIYSTIAPEQDNSIYQLMKEADKACIRFKLIPNFNFLIKQPVHIEYMYGLPVLSIRQEPLNDVANQIKKRVFDIVLSFLVIILILSWMIPLVALLIWIESPGPIFFVQNRSGKDNKPFPCIKFRSMKINKEANSKQAAKNDQRITRVGGFLRRTSLDEFPQFLNVFIGQMSIVGPRPHMLKHTDDYSALINQYMVRHFLKPGITGWAQINGFRGETKTQEQMEGRVKHDLWYLENWSLYLDIRIIILTAYNIFRGEENAF